MALPADVRQAAVSQVERYCDERVPEELRADIRLEHSVRGNAITIVERRPPWSELVGPSGRRRTSRSCATTTAAGRSTAAIVANAGGCTTTPSLPPTSDRCWKRSTKTRPASSGADRERPRSRRGGRRGSWPLDRDGGRIRCC